jgi:hypothetical protein
MVRALAAAFAFLTVIFISAAILLPRLPPNWRPWGPPALDAPPTPFSHLQISHLSRNRDLCLAALNAAAQSTITPLPDRTMDGDCGYTNVVRIQEAPVSYNATTSTTCALAAALYWWELELQHRAEALLGQPLKRIEHVGTFACRSVNGKKGRGQSQHAFANAIDVSAFVLADGRRLVIAERWNAGGAEAAFVHAARDAACRYFNGVLSPDYNALHAGHFHLDIGPYLMCR